MTKLFVGGLPYSVDNNKLNEIFASFGEVVSATVIFDKYTNTSKGFGFVEMASDDAAQKAIKSLDGSDLEGRKLGVSIAKPREDKPRDGGYNSNRGGYNKNRY